jgi:hypothetical protein
VGTWFRPIGVGVPAHRMTSDGRVAYVVHRCCLGGWCREISLRVSSVLEGSPGRTYPCSRPVAIVEVPCGRVAFRIEQESPL